MKVSAQYAETHLSQLFAAAKAGEDVEIAQSDETAFRLILLSSTGAPKRPDPSATRRRILGAGRGELRVPNETEWQHMKRETEEQMIRSTLLSTEEV